LVEMKAGEQTEASWAFVDRLGQLVRGLAGSDDGSTSSELVARWLRESLAVGAFALVDTSGDRPRVIAAEPLDVSTLELSGPDGCGPSSVAGRTSSTITCADLDTWSETLPEYVEAARALGVRAVATLPLVAHGTAFGALCLYAGSIRAWSEYDLAVGALLADLVASRLDHLSALNGQRLLTDQLQGALSSRVLIEQAKGVLAASECIDVEVAFGRIRNHARRTNTKIAIVASDVITKGLRPPPA
jgi:GAF domain-containing protein